MGSGKTTSHASPIVRVLARGPVRLWVIKAVVQKSLSLAPGGTRLNLALQRQVTRKQRLTTTLVERKLRRLEDHMEGFRRISGREVPAVALELGTGWWPIVPLGLFLAGVDRIWTIDLTRHVTRERFIETAQALLESAEPGERADRLREAIASDDPLDRMAERVGVTFLIGDASRTVIPPASVDLIVSNNTLEHVDERALGAILDHFRTLLAPGGVMSHFVDLSDHFSHMDRTITPYNFLRFSRRAWRLIDNGIQPQNRLRRPHYEAMHDRAGLRVVESVPEGVDLELLGRVRVHADFAAMPAEEVGVRYCHFYSVPAEASAGA